MPRFVILEHDHPSLHWDLMLEAGDVLQAWRLAAPPTESDAVEATQLGDHRRAYLDYEGPVSGNRGTVKRWDAGTFHDDIDSTPTARILVFAGTRICGRWRLTPHGAHWLMAPAPA
ncbi:MAG TPA: DNA polymerase ligase N-terminal domain-containing protein [Gemmataceae bacterium]|nr:DNA polymerase ligase N-terminal domain-containing protein [Gemmataceae bacterium]